MSKKLLHYLSILSLLVSFAAICYMLAGPQNKWVGNLFLAYGLFLIVADLFMFVPRKFHNHFLELCQNPIKFSGLRLGLSIAIFILGWYINGAATAYFGEGSPEVAYNGIAMLTPLFTLIGHVSYAGCVKKSKSWEKPAPKHL